MAKSRYVNTHLTARVQQKSPLRNGALSAVNGERYHFNLSVSVSNFVPKPGTPFERVRGNSEEELIEKIRYLKECVRKVKGVSFKYHDTRMSRVEMMLAKGDRRVSEVVRLAAERGAGFDSWREFFSYENWLCAFKDAGLLAVLGAGDPLAAGVLFEVLAELPLQIAQLRLGAG